MPNLTYFFEPKHLNLSKPREEDLTGDPSIDLLNLVRIIAKSLDNVSGYGWDLSTAENIAQMYRGFLFLCKTYPDRVIVPPQEVDAFWHLHILDTRNYTSDCQIIFGYYLHHFPYSGLIGCGLSAEQEHIYLEGTLDLVRKHFPHWLDSL